MALDSEQLGLVGLCVHMHTLTFSCAVCGSVPVQSVSGTPTICVLLSASEQTIQCIRDSAFHCVNIFPQWEAR